MLILVLVQKKKEIKVAIKGDKNGFLIYQTWRVWKHN